MDGLYWILDAIFSPVLGMKPIYSEIFIALAMTFLVTVVYRVLSNPKQLKELKDRAKEITSKSKELQKTNPEEAKKLTTEMMAISNKQMMAGMKPMMGSLLIAVLFFPWMASKYIGPVVQLPVTLPYFSNDFGWIMWYMMVSLPASQIFRKVLGVDL